MQSRDYHLILIDNDDTRFEQVDFINTDWVNRHYEPPAV
jgi:hypothetical protein